MIPAFHASSLDPFQNLTNVKRRDGIGRGRAKDPWDSLMATGGRYYVDPTPPRDLPHHLDIPADVEGRRIDVGPNTFGVSLCQGYDRVRYRALKVEKLGVGVVHAGGTGGNMFVAKSEAQIGSVYGSQYCIYRSHVLTSDYALITVRP